MNADEAVGRLTEVVRRKHLALTTGRTYCAWLRRYCDFFKGPPPHLPSEHKLERFVIFGKGVAPSTRSQAVYVIISQVRGRPRPRRLGVSIRKIRPGRVHLQAIPAGARLHFPPRRPQPFHSMGLRPSQELRALGICHSGPPFRNECETLQITCPVLTIYLGSEKLRRL